MVDFQGLRRMLIRYYLSEAILRLKSICAPAIAKRSSDASLLLGSYNVTWRAPRFEVAWLRRSETRPVPREVGHLKDVYSTRL